VETVVSNIVGNLTGVNLTYLTPEVSDAYFFALPKLVLNYLRFESPILWNPIEVYKLCQRVSPEVAVAAIKRTNDKQTDKAYPGLRTFRKQQCSS
jgi:hypothetical protein